MSRAFMSPRKHSISRPRKGSCINIGSPVSAGRHVSLKQNAAVHSVDVEGDDGGIEMKFACQRLKDCIGCRSKYKAVDKGQSELNSMLPLPIIWKFVDGILWFSGQTTSPVSWNEFYDDVNLLRDTASSAQCQTTCRYRLQVLEEKFNLYKLSNSEAEENMDRYRRGGGVFADTTKVDNSVNLTTSMNSLQLLQYIQRTHEQHGNDVVRLVGDKKEPQTLSRMFEVLDIQDPGSLTVDGLGICSLSEKSQLAFLNPELNRSGRSSAEVLRVFLTRNEVNNGLYLAGAVKPHMAKNDARDKYIQCTEYSIEVNGYAEDEWEKTAKWVSAHGLDKYINNSWVIVIPREVDNMERNKYDFEFHNRHFQNFFTPLVMATSAPEDPKNTDLAEFLKKVGVFTIRSDEENREADFSRKPRPPTEVSWKENVCDLYFAYYFWANMVSLNAMRKRLGLNTFQLRAVSSRHLDVLVYSYLLGDAITNGLMLDDQPVLQYLYGIHHIGVCISPLSNNALSTPYFENPFPKFFGRGLRVSLCTEHPLLYHHSHEPLIEEYGSACNLYRMTGIDMCELARNSVLISAFPEARKQQWLGERYQFNEEGRGNFTDMSNVPTSRLKFREDRWLCEVNIIESIASGGQISPSRIGFSNLSLHSIRDENVDYPRVVFTGPIDRDSQHTLVSQLLFKALEMRKAYLWNKADTETTSHIRIENAFRKNSEGNNFNEDEWMYKTVEGVVVPHEVHQIPRLPKEMYRYEDFRVHVNELKGITDNVHVKAFSRRRLELLEHKFKLHLAVNHSSEAGSTTEKMSQNRDFYQTTKVDTNVRMESGMTARQLLNFIVTKANNNGDDIVNQPKMKEPQTLRQLLKELDINPDHLTVDDLNVQVDTALMAASQQFTPEARDDLLTLVLKTDNTMKGRYFAELTKLTFENFKRDKFTFAENRLPVYGSSSEEWDMLSNWFDTHGMACHNNQWMVQVPRIYGYLRRQGKVTNFAEYLENIFKPLWSVSLHPSKNPRLFHFVDHVAGFDCVEDERRSDIPLVLATMAPQEWTHDDDPPYNYYIYHIWANIYSLNEFRMRRNFSTFSFRPSCGENGSIDHLHGGFLLANAINYGIRLKDDMALQYLFYLAQVGVAVSPLSNNTKVLDYLENPFPIFFKRGLNVSLSTDGPLQFHHTQEPLIEEYSIASKVWKLSPNDMCEIARNSVKQSGFAADFKKERIGQYYFLSSSKSNDAIRTHLSDIRVAYRWETYHTEVSLLEHLSGLKFIRAMMTAREESIKIAEVQSLHQSTDKKLGGIIDVTHDQAGVLKLSSKRAFMQKQVEDLTSTLSSLQQQNKHLKNKLNDEIGREQQAQELRKFKHSSDANEYDFIKAGKNGDVHYIPQRYESDSDESDYEDMDSPTNCSRNLIIPDINLSVADKSMMMTAESEAQKSCHISNLSVQPYQERVSSRETTNAPEGLSCLTTFDGNSRPNTTNASRVVDGKEMYPHDPIIPAPPTRRR